jgi:hypothetical protein
MAYHSRAPVHPTIGRVGISSEETAALRWMFLLVLLAGLIVMSLTANSLLADQATRSSITRSLGFGEPERVRAGYIPGAAGSSEQELGDALAIALPEPLITAPVVAAPTSPAPPSGAGELLRVANTDGVGVVLHTAPRKDARVPRGLLEGARATVLERGPDDWVRVRGENGQEGWVPAQYLVPVD